MYWIEDTDATQVQPTPPQGTGQKKYFTSGNVSTGTPATHVQAHWLNTMQNELLHCLEEAEITPDITDDTQLMLALRKMFYAKSGGGEGGGGSDLPVGIWNKQDIVETSGTYTAPITGWYRITLIGGGAGGSSGGAYIRTTTGYLTRMAFGGVGGGQGEEKEVYIRLNKGDIVEIVVGGGGVGGQSFDIPQATGMYSPNVGTNGGQTTLSIGDVQYISEGGKAAMLSTSSDLKYFDYGGLAGGNGITSGFSTENGYVNEVNYTNNAGSTPDASGTNGGGPGGGRGAYITATGVFAGEDGRRYGAGGGGGGVCNAGVSGKSSAGGNGANGAVIFEYFQDDTTEEVA